MIIEENKPIGNLPQPDPSIKQQKRRRADENTKRMQRKHHVNKLGAARSSEREWRDVMHLACFHQCFQHYSHRRGSALTHRERSHWLPTDVMDPRWGRGIQRTNWSGQVGRVRRGISTWRRIFMGVRECRAILAKHFLISFN